MKPIFLLLLLLLVPILSRATCTGGVWDVGTTALGLKLVTNINSLVTQTFVRSVVTNEDFAAIGVQATDNATSARWDFLPIAGGSTFRLRNSVTGFYLESTSSSSITAQPFDEAENNQIFDLISVSTSYRIRSVPYGSDLCASSTSLSQSFALGACTLFRFNQSSCVCDSFCNLHGNAACLGDTCTCHVGYGGTNCTTTCTIGFTGIGCVTATCYHPIQNLCSFSGDCNYATNRCRCRGQATGATCETTYTQDYHAGLVGSSNCTGTRYPYPIQDGLFSVIASPGSVCSAPYGYCELSTCQCARHRSGPNCTVWTGCWGGGEFTPPSTCVCNSGRRGPQCEYYALGTSCYNSSLVACAGGGQCASEPYDGVHESTLDSFACRCDTGYSGVGCQTLSSCGVGSTGFINGTGLNSTCQCRAGFTGRACEHDGCWVASKNIREYSVTCAVATCGNTTGGLVCTGHGSCAVAPLSICDCYHTQPTYAGFYCDAILPLTCNTSCVTNGLNCSSHGVCNATSHRCACQAFHEGCDCEVATNPCNYPPHPYQCNFPRGHCVGPTDPGETQGHCVCDSGWALPFCDVSSICVVNGTTCGGRGTCNSDGYCDCDDGFYGGTNQCGLVACQGHNCSVVATVPCYNRAGELCSNRGVCLLPGTPSCSCDEGFGGQACEFGAFCAPHGNTHAGAACDCDESWYGDNCEFTCGEGTHYFYTEDACACANGRPAVTACNCTSGYYGPACKTSRCIDLQTLVVCGDHGTCTAYNNCTCDNGYVGVRCETRVPMTCDEGVNGFDCEFNTCNNPITGEACSGSDRGECIGEFMCACVPPAVGITCRHNYTQCNPLHTVSTSAVEVSTGVVYNYTTLFEPQDVFCDCGEFDGDTKCFDASNADEDCLLEGFTPFDWGITCACSGNAYSNECGSGDVYADADVCNRDTGECACPPPTHRRICNEGWTGPYCNITTCINPINGLVCSGRGTCSGAGVCVCETWSHGPTCRERFSGCTRWASGLVENLAGGSSVGSLQHTVSQNCSAYAPVPGYGRGAVVGYTRLMACSHTRCTCQNSTYVELETCELRSPYRVPRPLVSASCDAALSGCSIASNNPSPSDNCKANTIGALTCSGHGQCLNSSGGGSACDCDDGWFISTRLDQTSHIDGYCASTLGDSTCFVDNVGICNLHGNCDGNVCVCEAGRTGVLCASVCSDPFQAGHCGCYTPSFGPDWAAGGGCATCSGGVDTTPSLGSGTHPRRAGPWCCHTSYTDSSRTSRPICGGRGTCAPDSTCTCTVGLGGDHCCPLGGSVVCSGRGVCSETGACACGGPWGGPACEVDQRCGACASGSECVTANHIRRYLDLLHTENDTGPSVPNLSVTDVSAIIRAQINVTSAASDGGWYKAISVRILFCGLDPDSIVAHVSRHFVDCSRSPLVLWDHLYDAIVAMLDVPYCRVQWMDGDREAISLRVFLLAHGQSQITDTDATYIQAAVADDDPAFAMSALLVYKLRRDPVSGVALYPSKSGESKCVCDSTQSGPDCAADCPLGTNGQPCGGFVGGRQLGVCDYSSATCQCPVTRKGDACDFSVVGMCTPTSNNEVELCSGRGVCTELDVGLYACACPGAWEGDFCEISVCSRDETECSNAGTCIASVCSFLDGCTDPTCTCSVTDSLAATSPSLPLGVFCEVDGLSQCATQHLTSPLLRECNGHGTCTVGDDVPMCVCDDGYTGARCNISLCGDPGCNHRELCNEGPGTCSCRAKYVTPSGSCTNNSIECRCLAHLCSHGVPSADGATCVCDTNYRVDSSGNCNIVQCPLVVVRDSGPRACNESGLTRCVFPSNLVSLAQKANHSHYHACCYDACVRSNGATNCALSGNDPVCTCDPDVAFSQSGGICYSRCNGHPYDSGCQCDPTYPLFPPLDTVHEFLSILNCARVSCLNGGTVASSGQSCVCLTDYSGATCATFTGAATGESGDGGGGGSGESRSSSSSSSGGGDTTTTAVASSSSSASISTVGSSSSVASSSSQSVSLSSSSSSSSSTAGNTTVVVVVDTANDVAVSTGATAVVVVGSVAVGFVVVAAVLSYAGGLTATVTAAAAAGTGAATVPSSAAAASYVLV